jgi:beta-glucosidase
LNLKAVKFIDGILNRWYLDPIFNASYPKDILDYLTAKYDFPSIPKEDLKLLKDNPVDFLGINNYSCTWVGADNSEELTSVNKLVKQERREGREYSVYGWETCPEGFFDLLIRVNKDYNHPSIYITENGMAAKDDIIEEGIIQDEDRLNYLKRYFEAAYRAIENGVNLKGYFIWSLLDNFEWFAGYSIRFGIIGVDYKTQERVWKRSALWYRDVIAENGFD